MRRILVIFLVLLFPLNVLALSLSVSLAQQNEVLAHAAVEAPAADTFAGDTTPDIDPDEPPSVAELHDLVNQERCLHLAGVRAGAVPPHDAAPYCHSFPPPVKPPRNA